MDISSHQICSDPKTWVFDGLVSPALLEQVDQNFRPQMPLLNGTEGVDTWTVDDPVLAQEFIDLLVQICGIEPVENSLQQVILGDIRKKSQSCHMDRLEVGGRFQHVREDAIGFLDISKQDVKTRPRLDGSARTIVPTMSLVVYFEDYPGGIHFPNAPGFDSAATAASIRGEENGGMSIDGRRGRIIMFQNYHSDHSLTNPMARHFGTFNPLVPKRNFIGGVVSNENPQDYASRKSHSVPGLLYGVCKPKMQNDSFAPQTLGWDGSPGHHHEHHNWEEQAEAERLGKLLSASISRETVVQYPTRRKEALIHLLTIFSRVDLVRELMSMKPITLDVWWYILSMMNGTDLTVDNEEEDDNEDEWTDDKEEAGLVIVTWIKKIRTRT